LLFLAIYDKILIFLFIIILSECSFLIFNITFAVYYYSSTLLLINKQVVNDVI